jgi:hypothetical protein
LRNCLKPILRFETLTEGVQWTCSDVAVNDAERNES